MGEWFFNVDFDLFFSVLVAFWFLPKFVNLYDSERDNKATFITRSGGNSFHLNIYLYLVPLLIYYLDWVNYCLYYLLQAFQLLISLHLIKVAHNQINNIVLGGSRLGNLTPKIMYVTRLKIIFLISIWCNFWPHWSREKVPLVHSMHCFLSNSKCWPRYINLNVDVLPCRYLVANVKKWWPPMKSLISY